MGILGDIGRSNVGQAGQSVFGDIMRYKQSENQDATAILNAQHQEKTMEIAQAKETRDKVEFDAKQKEAARRLPLTYYLGDESTWPKSISVLVAEGEKTGHVKMENGVRTTSPQGAKDFIEYLKVHNPDKALESSAMKLSELSTDIGAVKSKLAKNPGDEKATAELQALSEKFSTQQASHQALAEGLAAKKKAEGGDKEAREERRLDLAEQTANDRAEAADRAQTSRDEANDRKFGIMEKNSNTLARNAETAAKRAVSSGSQLTFAEKEVIRAMGKQLPKTQTLARTAEKNIQKIDRMEGLIASGAGGVRGDLLAKINKAADLFRRTSPEDAKYNRLKSEMMGLAGSLRLQLGLVGQTSDRDVQIMQEAAGMGTPAESQKALMEGYKQGFMQDINNYNSDSDAYSNAPGMEGKPRLFKPITVAPGGRSNAPTIVETRKTKDGRTLEKLSDGSIREAK